jgi:hypothetical protein
VTEQLILLVLLAAGLAAYGWWQWHERQQRREAIALLCLERGWSFAHERDELVQQLRGTFPLFTRGTSSRRCRNVVSIPGDQRSMLFDYSYVTRRGKSTSTTHVAVAIIRLPVWLPAVRLSPENPLTRVASAVGFRDIELESVEFNRRFRVEADSREHAFAILHPLMMEHLLALPYDTWELAGGRLLVSRAGRWELGDYQTVQAAISRSIELIPDHVWRQHGASP